MGHWRRKTCIEELIQLNIGYFKKNGFLGLGTSGQLVWERYEGSLKEFYFRVEPNTLVVEYQRRMFDNSWERKEQQIWIDQTACNYGGERNWFRCPACSKRSVKLYNKNSVFLCRCCCRLPYKSQRESPHDRKLRRCRKIRAKLGGSNNLTISIPQKPKGMHWRKFEQLSYQEKIANSSAVMSMGALLGIICVDDEII